MYSFLKNLSPLTPILMYVFLKNLSTLHFPYREIPLDVHVLKMMDRWLPPHLQILTLVCEKLHVLENNGEIVDEFEQREVGNVGDGFEQREVEIVGDEFEQREVDSGANGENGDVENGENGDEMVPPASIALFSRRWISSSDMSYDAFSSFCCTSSTGLFPIRTLEDPFSFLILINIGSPAGRSRSYSSWLGPTNVCTSSLAS